MNTIKARHKNKNNRRFASREDVIRHTIEREREEYNTAGIGKSTVLLRLKCIFNPFEEIGEYLIDIIMGGKKEKTRFMVYFFCMNEI